jgi:hypothetical protein
MKVNYIERIVAEGFLEEMRLDPGIASLLRNAGEANPFLLADQIVQKLKAGGSHDKKN